MARGDPAALGTKLMGLYAARDGTAMRDFLAPAEPEPMQTEPASPLPPAAATLQAEQSALLTAMCEGDSSMASASCRSSSVSPRNSGVLLIPKLSEFGARQGEDVSAATATCAQGDRILSAISEQILYRIEDFT